MRSGRGEPVEPRRPPGLRHVLFRNRPHGMILRLRDTDASAPTMPCGERLLSWQMYSHISVPGLHRMMKPPVHVVVYAPGSSTIASYLSELKSVRVKRSTRCSCSVCGVPSRSIQNFVLNPTVSTTNVSPSQRPVECPE